MLYKHRHVFNYIYIGLGGAHVRRLRMRMRGTDYIQLFISDLKSHIPDNNKDICIYKNIYTHI
jgi:hypothetical protein